jgi:glutamate-1-semialdehyde 2,1-aminomutase
VNCNAAIEKTGAAMQFTGYGSMLNVHMRRGEIRNPGEAAQGNAKLRELFYFDMLELGFYSMPKRGLMALALPHTEADCSALVAAVEEFIQARRSLLN